jgi:hypothetical protein
MNSLSESEDDFIMTKMYRAWEKKGPVIIPALRYPKNKAEKLKSGGNLPIGLKSIVV